MNNRTTPYPDREIIYRWAVAEIGPAISRVLSAKGLMRPDADRCIGFFYVDHEEGITFRIHSLCRTGAGKPPEIVVNFENHGEGLILSSDEVEAYTLLSDKEANRLSLLEEQRWLIYYEPEALQAVRKRVDLDRFRAPGCFDDVSVILYAKDHQTIPEGVWVRLEGQSDDGASLRGTLLNEPYSDFGVHEGEIVTVRFAEEEEGRFLVAETGS
ncbi:hypothetical protein FGW20_08830 [Methanoculleus sp. FWC-SCC3]|uniref:Uncharacterized protein n=1 Tax=Methanoculleus methanifontis TaxID=2584086 RepID=A0ABT8M3H3_9EURY|nr:hypothetical protein [Methanoculleus sp. FWC-SCC3]MDN7013141.1 hypothetical protein [Methanoculleus sp. FWC-SCC3]